MNKEDIRKFVEENPNIVKRTQSKTYPDLYVLKYKNKVFYDNLWHLNPILLNLRGAVVDEDYNPIVLPFRKIFNQYENNTNIPRDEKVVAVEKINGFMAAVTYHPVYHNIVSTTGSLDSNFVQMAKHILPTTDYRHFFETRFIPTTWLFEIVHPNDPHVIPEEVGAYLIGGRYPVWGEDEESIIDQDYLDHVAKSMGVMRPAWKETRFSDVCKAAKDCRHEGYVVYGKNTNLKIKSPYYKITKLFGRGNLDKLFKNPESLRKTIDEEYYPLIDYLVGSFDKFKTLEEQEKMSYVREFIQKQN